MTRIDIVVNLYWRIWSNDVISDVTADRFWLEFSVFGTCEYYNLISLHPMFTKIDMVDSQPIVTNLIEWRPDDVTADRFWLEFSVFGTYEYYNLKS